MTYILTDSLRPGMVVARKLTGNNNRVLLRAGVALSETHIRALRSLGIRGLEIRGITTHTAPIRPHSTPAPQPAPPATTDTDHPQSARHTPFGGDRGLVQRGEHDRSPQPTALAAQRTDTLTNAVLEGTGVAPDSALALVVRKCAIRILHSRNSQHIDENSAP